MEKSIFHRIEKCFQHVRKYFLPVGNNIFHY